MRLDRAWIEAHIPHGGRMCLLDEVLAWDAERISCLSGTHRAADHPLRAYGRLGVATGVEYAAQAMAVHGALLAGAGGDAGGAAASTLVAAAPSAVPTTLSATPASATRAAAAPGGSSAAIPAAGFLASVRSVRMFVARLDDVPGDLICHARRLAGDRGTALYEFDLRCETACLLTGRASVVLDATGRLPT